MRWSRPGLDAELRLLTGVGLGPHEAPPNISIVVGEGRGRSRTKHQLSVQGQPTCVTRRDGPLVRAVVRAVGALTTTVPHDGLTVNAFLLLRPDGRAVAVDRRLAADFRRIEPRLRRSGLTVADVPWVVLNAGSATAVLADGAGALGLRVDDVDQRWPRDGTDDDLTAGEVAVERIVHVGGRDPESLAAAVGDMVPLVGDATRRVKVTDVELLAAFADRTQVVGLPGGDPGGLLERLTWA